MPRDWNAFMGGSFAERLDEQVDLVAENVQDPNYKATEIRSVFAKIDFKGDEERDIAEVSFTVWCKLPKKLPVRARVYFGRDSKGKATCNELHSANPNQLELEVNEEGTTEVKSNTGVDLLQKV